VLCQINVQTKEVKILSPFEGWMDASFTQGMKYYVGSYSNGNMPPVFALYKGDGSLVKVMENNSALNTTLSTLNLSKKTYQTVMVNGTALNVSTIFPPNFNESNKYPVYMNVYGGGHKRDNTFIEYSKALVDKLNAYYTEQSSLQVDEFTKTTNSIHFYDSIVVYERKLMIPPSSKMMGKWSFENEIKKKTFFEKLKFHALLRINKVLQTLKIKGIYVDEMIRLSCMR
jgi:hypothetical protein